MKRKFITGIMAFLLAFVFVFAACTDEVPDGGTGDGTDVGTDIGTGDDNKGDDNKGDDNKTKTYTVTFDVNGGAPMQNSTQTVTLGQAFNLGVTTRANFYFDGWTYDGKLITDANGKGNGVWSIEQDVTVMAKWSAGAVDTGNDDVSGLIAAIANMGHNYTSSVFYNSGLNWAYDHYCTNDGIYMWYGSEYASSGFIFNEVEGESLAYFFEVKDGLALIDEEPYTWMDGDPYTQEYVYGRDYHASVINPEYYVNLGNGVYSCKSDYLYQQGRALIYENDPSEILITVTNGYIDYIAINDFTDRDYGGTDSVWMNFEKIGSTSIEKYLLTERLPYPPQLPSPTDPNKPQAPTTYGSDDTKPVDPFDTSVYVNGANDNALPALKAAIDNARQSIRYNIEEYFDDTCNKGNTENWSPSSQYYIAQFEGYKSYVANAYYDYSPRVSNYIVKSGGKVYRIDHDGDIIKYVERDSTFEERTFGGNYFNKLNASMFEQSAADSNVYTVKSAYLNTVNAILFETARGKDSFYNGNPTIRNVSVTVTLNANGQFSSILAERIFDFNDGKPADIQQMKFSFDYNTPLVMPYESEYTADELVLKHAIAAMGSNYTLDHIYYDGTQITEYYADEGIWKWYGQEWGSSGFVYINDYAYFMDLKDGVLEVDDKIWWGFDAPKGENNDYYYFRAWMNIFYLPLAQLDAKDFTRISNTVFQLKTSAFKKYDGMFFDFEDEGGMLSMSIVLGEDGKIARIECTCADYTGSSSDVATSVVYVGAVGTTKLPEYIIGSPDYTPDSN